MINPNARSDLARYAGTYGGYTKVQPKPPTLRQRLVWLVKPQCVYTEAQLQAAVAKAKKEERELLHSVAMFLAELPQDLGRGSLNGMRVQLQHAIMQLSTDEALDAMAKNADDLGLNY